MVLSEELTSAVEAGGLVLLEAVHTWLQSAGRLFFNINDVDDDDRTVLILCIDKSVRGEDEGERTGPTITQTEISMNQAKLSGDKERYEESLCEAIERLGVSESSPDG